MLLSLLLVGFDEHATFPFHPFHPFSFFENDEPIYILQRWFTLSGIKGLSLVLLYESYYSVGFGSSVKCRGTNLRSSLEQSSFLES